MKILIVEDHPKMAQSLKSGLREVGYTAEIAESGTGAEILVTQGEFDLILLDVMLPEQNGIDTARHLRKNGYEGPILMLTALSTTKDKVIGLDAGADDYLTKPYSFEELLARIRALIRRGSQSPGGRTSIVAHDDLELDLLRRKAFRQGIEISLTAKEFSLLEYFLRNPERPLSRMEIAEKVWNIQFDPESNVIDVFINILRKKIDSPFKNKLIHTVVGFGYVLRREQKTDLPLELPPS